MRRGGAGAEWAHHPLRSTGAGSSANPQGFGVIIQQRVHVCTCVTCLSTCASVGSLGWWRRCASCVCFINCHVLAYLGMFGKMSVGLGSFGPVSHVLGMLGQVWERCLLGLFCCSRHDWSLCVVILGNLGLCLIAFEHAGGGSCAHI